MNFEETKIQLILNLVQAYHEITNKMLKATYDELHEGELKITLEESKRNNVVNLTLTNTNLGFSKTFSDPWFELQNNSYKLLRDYLDKFEGEVNAQKVAIKTKINSLLYKAYVNDPDVVSEGDTMTAGIDITNNMNLSFMFDESNRGIFKVTDVNNNLEVLNLTLPIQAITPTNIINNIIPIINQSIEVYTLD